MVLLDDIFFDILCDNPNKVIMKCVVMFYKKAGFSATFNTYKG